MPVTHEVTSSSLVGSAIITTMEIVLGIIGFLIFAGLYIAVVAIAIHINKDLYKDLPEESRKEIEMWILYEFPFHSYWNPF